MTKLGVLFVDDEPQILDGLCDRLYGMQKRWKMHFVRSGAAALALLGKEPVDVIVSDMRMPEMDGATLLKKVQAQYPKVVRIVLSGHAEVETALRAVPVAHQFLSKPCEARVIEEVITRACNLQSLINEDVVRRAVSQIKSLPAAPRVYSQLVAMLASEATSAAAVAKVLKQDMALCAKVLQVVNSSFFGLSRNIARVDEAVTYLGFNTVKQVVLAVEVFQQPSNHPDPRLSPDCLQQHAMAVATLAASFFSEKPKKEDAFVSGLLHDIGKLLLATELPDHLRRVLEVMDASRCPIYVAEEAVWGVTHAEVGAYLLGLWGLPYPVVEAVANHHAPGRVDANEFGVLASTHIADGLINEVGAAAEPGACEPEARLDLAYVEKIGQSGRLDEWREAARQRLGRE